MYLWFTLSVFVYLFRYKRLNILTWMAINHLYTKHWERLGRRSGKEKRDEHRFINPTVLNPLYVCVCFQSTLLGRKNQGGSKGKEERVRI